MSHALRRTAASLARCSLSCSLLALALAGCSSTSEETPTEPSAQAAPVPGSPEWMEEYRRTLAQIRAGETATAPPAAPAAAEEAAPSEAAAAAQEQEAPAPAQEQAPPPAPMP